MDVAIISRLYQICHKICMYQFASISSEAATLELLKVNEVLSEEDFEFLANHSIRYNPTASVAFAGQMFSCVREGEQVFLGPVSEPQTIGTLPLNEARGHLKVAIESSEFLILEIAGERTSVSLLGDLLTIQGVEDYSARSAVKNLVRASGGIILDRFQANDESEVSSRVPLQSPNMEALVMDLLVNALHLPSDCNIKMTMIGRR